MVEFSDLIIQESAHNMRMTVDCLGITTGTSLQATSDLFHVYDVPTTGLRTKVTTVFSYEGRIENVRKVIDDFDTSLGSLTCPNCPTGRYKDLDFWP